VGFSPAEATFKWCGRSPHVLEVDGDDKISQGRDGRWRSEFKGVNLMPPPISVLREEASALSPD
jgi:hypothetical protein